MADKTVGELPAAQYLHNDSLFVVEQQGVAMKLTGRQIKLTATGGIPDGGTAGQVLAKRTSNDQDAYWIDPPQGGGFVEMTTSIPVSNRKPDTLYGLIVKTYS